MGLVAVLHVSVYQNIKVVLLPRFTPSSFFGAISKYKATNLALVPPMVIAMLQAPPSYDFSSVRLVISGAAPLAGEVRSLLTFSVRRKLTSPSSTMQTAKAFVDKYLHITLNQAYGLSEAVCCISFGTGNEQDGASSGRLLPGTEYVLPSSSFPFVCTADTETIFLSQSQGRLSRGKAPPSRRVGRTSRSQCFDVGNNVYVLSLLRS
jgi:acyl-CoA synthetase (AMP-forming)/AMP-acid ligase II